MNNRTPSPQDRMRMACSLLTSSLPAGCSFRRPTGGYFIWITFPASIDADRLLAYAREHHKVSAIAGQVFSADGAFRHCVRLSIAFHRIERLQQALQKFCLAATEFMASQSSQ